MVCEDASHVQFAVRMTTAAHRRMRLPVGQLHQVVGGEAVFVCQHVVVGGAAGALQPGVRVEVERVLEGVLQVTQPPPSASQCEGLHLRAVAAAAEPRNGMLLVCRVSTVR